MAGHRGDTTKLRPARRALLVAPVAFVLLLLTPGPAAAAPTLLLTPADGTPGASVTVTGRDFAECVEPDTGDTYVEVLWDGTPRATEVERASYGTFEAALTAPADAATGDHVVSARCSYASGEPGPELASATFTVRPPPTTPPAGPALRLRPDSGRPGDVVDADGTGFPTCDIDTRVPVELLWDGAPTGASAVPKGGAFTVPLTVPGGVGAHVVTARCADSTTVLATAAFGTLAVVPTTAPPTPVIPTPTGGTAAPSPTGTTAAPTPPLPATPPATALPTAAGSGDAPAAAPRTVRRAWVPATLPTTVDTTLRDLVRSAALALLLVLLVGFPAELVNSTAHENADRIRRAFRRLTARAARLPRPPDLPAPARLAAFTVVAAALTSFADPRAGFDAETLVTLAGLLVAIPVTLLAFEVPVELWSRRGGNPPAALRVLPGALAVAAVLALVSRVAGFEPAYVYGLVAGYAVVAGRALTAGRAGQAVLAGAASMLGVSLLAWAAWLTLGEPDATLAARLADSVLAAVALVGVEGLVFALLPVRFLDGEALWRWGRRRWAAAYGVVAFVFVHLLLTSHAERVGGAEVARMLALFAAFGVASVAFWAWFRFRPEPA